MPAGEPAHGVSAHVRALRRGDEEEQRGHAVIGAFQPPCLDEKGAQAAHIGDHEDDARQLQRAGTGRFESHRLHEKADHDRRNDREKRPGQGGQRRGGIVADGPRTRDGRRPQGFAKVRKPIRHSDRGHRAEDAVERRADARLPQQRGHLDRSRAHGKQRDQEPKRIPGMKPLIREENRKGDRRQA